LPVSVVRFLTSKQEDKIAVHELQFGCLRRQFHKGADAMGLAFPDRRAGSGDGFSISGPE
jgi:hypothetical protein